MTAALKGAIRNFGFKAALALGAMLSVPSAASAQYTLTFDAPQSSGADGTLIPGTYLYPGVNGVAVNITDGYESAFGSTSLDAEVCTGSSN